MAAQLSGVCDAGALRVASPGGGTGGRVRRKKGEEDERPAQAASRQRLLAISRHSQRTLATWEGFVKDGLKFSVETRRNFSRLSCSTIVGSMA